MNADQSFYEDLEQARGKRFFALGAEGAELCCMTNHVCVYCVCV